MDILSALNKEEKQALIEGAKDDSWMKVNNDSPNHDFLCSVNFPKTLKDPKHIAFWRRTFDIGHRASQLGHNSTQFFLMLYSYSKYLSDGPKIFVPSIDQCLAMSMTEIKVPSDCYSQPYDVIKINFPQRLNEFIGGYKIEANHMIMAKIGTLLFINMATNSETGVGYHALIDLKEDQTLEDNLKGIDEECLNKDIQGGDLNADFERDEILTWSKYRRMALNMALMLSNNPFSLRPLDPKGYIKSRKLAAKLNPAKKSLAEYNLRVHPMVMEFEQNIKFSDNETGVDGPRLESTSSNSRATHWRKGHWRNQAYGPNRSLRKLILIKPALVNKQNFIGELSSTKITYEL